MKPDPVWEYDDSRDPPVVIDVRTREVVATPADETSGLMIVEAVNKYQKMRRILESLVYADQNAVAPEDMDCFDRVVGSIAAEAEILLWDIDQDGVYEC